MQPRDVVAIILAMSMVIDPLAIVVSLAVWGKSLSQIGGETIEAIEVAKLAVLAGYLATRNPV